MEWDEAEPGVYPSGPVGGTGVALTASWLGCLTFTPLS